MTPGSADVKIVFAAISAVLEVVAFYPYFRDIFLRKTQPHAYSWLIWAITQGTATAAVWYGGGGWGATGLATGMLLIGMVFLLTFIGYGTKTSR